ncbi:hypothetical protein ACWGRK_17035 [Saccharomonospora azurea]|uniref:hypothetical protein n=1 Tax=Saccharomonospora azurea TaxID=40988 RepID=UPI003D8BF791
MEFAVQVGCPRTLRPEGPAADMADAISELYPLDTEDLILVWNLVPIRLSYRYDVSVLMDDLVPLLEEVQGGLRAERAVRWASDTFAAEWKLVPDRTRLRISAQWFSTLGNYEDLLNTRGVVETPVENFVREMGKIVDRTCADIEASGIEIEDEDILHRAQSLTEKA